MPTLAYIRVSDPRQASEDKTSLAAQRAAIEALAVRLGQPIDADGWYTEPGFSGGTADRPAFQQMLAYCRSHPRTSRDGFVLVYSDSRWGRFEDPEEAAHWRFVFRQLGWVVRFATNDEGGDPMARTLMRAMGAATASHERETIRERARMGGRGAAAKGFWGNREPFGYRRMAVDSATGATRVLSAGQRKGPNERLKLTPGPADEVAFVRWMFTTYASGTVSLAELTRLAPSRYPKEWIRRTLHQMLLNPAYAGDVVWASRAEDAATGQVVARNAHEALVDRETAALVQRVLARNRKETSPTRGGYPLSGLILCATCGSHFIGGGGRRGTDADPDALRFYRDAGASKRPRCPGHMATFLRRDIEPQVIDAVADVLDRHPVGPVIDKAITALLRAAGEGHNDQRTALEARRDADRRRLARLVAAVGDGTLKAAEAKSQLAEARQRIEGADLELERLRFGERRAERLEAERDRLVGLARDFRAQARRMSGTDLRELLRPWLASAVVDKHARTLTLEVHRIPSLGLFTSARLGQGRPCSPGACQPCCLP